jgi:hypothetical protein
MPVTSETVGKTALPLPRWRAAYVVVAVVVAAAVAGARSLSWCDVLRRFLGSADDMGFLLDSERKDIVVGGG